MEDMKALQEQLCMQRPVSWEQLPEEFDRYQLIAEDAAAQEALEQAPDEEKAAAEAAAKAEAEEKARLDRLANPTTEDLLKEILAELRSK